MEIKNMTIDGVEVQGVKSIRMTTLCKKCGLAFEPKTTWQKFCSDSCRVMNHNKNPKDKSDVSLEAGYICLSQSPIMISATDEEIRNLIEAESRLVDLKEKIAERMTNEAIRKSDRFTNEDRDRILSAAYHSLNYLR